LLRRARVDTSEEYEEIPMHAKAAKYEVQVNATLRGRRYWILKNGQRMDARKLGYTKAYFETSQAASDALEAL
jgi:hypothetical protein